MYSAWQTELLDESVAQSMNL